MYAYQKFLEFPNFPTKITLPFLPLILLIALLSSTLNAQAQTESETTVPPQNSITIETLPALEVPPEIIPGEENQDAVDSPETLPEEPSEESSTEQDNPDWFKTIQDGYGGETDSTETSSLESNDPNSETTPIGEEGMDILVEAVRKMVVGLFVVFALILILYYLVRRFGKHVPALSGLQLGQVLGQVHLTRSHSLHYVRSGGRVLVIGVSDAGINLVAEFDESAFDQIYPEFGEQDSFDPESFVQELKEQSASIRAEDPARPISEMKDDEISALRGDINRLQDYLQEENRDQND